MVPEVDITGVFIGGCKSRCLPLRFRRKVLLKIEPTLDDIGLLDADPMVVDQLLFLASGIKPTHSVKGLGLRSFGDFRRVVEKAYLKRKRPLTGMEVDAKAIAEAAKSKGWDASWRVMYERAAEKTKAVSGGGVAPAAGAAAAASAASDAAFMSVPSAAATSSAV